MRLKRNIAVSESGFIFNPATGDSFSANPVGLRILELLKAGIIDSEIISILTSEFNVEDDRMKHDLEDFQSMLQQLSLIEDG